MINNKIKDAIEDVIKAMVIPVLIIFFDLFFAATFIIEIFKEKQLIDRKSIMVGRINEYKEIPFSPNDLVNIILLSKPKSLINKLVIKIIIVFFTILTCTISPAFYKIYEKFKKYSIFFVIFLI